MPKIRQYPAVTSTLPSDAVLLDRLGVGTVYTTVANFEQSPDVATMTYPTLADAVAAVVPAGTSFLQLLGQQSLADCLPAIYAPAAAGVALGKFQSADGQWWAVAGSNVGCPEWFGAEHNTPAFDCGPALAACLAQFAVTSLAPVDYWIAATWKLNTPWRTVVGVGQNGQGSTPVTRIVSANAAVDLVQVGPDTQPGSIGAFLQGVTIQQVTIVRSVAPNLPPTGSDPRNGVSGLRAQYCLGCYFTNLFVSENINSLYVLANVACYYTGIHNGRTVAAVGGGTGADRYYGTFLDSSASIGLAGGNGSVYFNLISSACANVATNAFAYAYGGFTDTYWNQLECSGHANGMLLNGNGNTSPGSPTEDCHISQAIFDGLSGTGIMISGGNNSTAVLISNSYFANGSGQGVYVETSFGAVSVVGSQFIGTASSVGIRAFNASGVTDTNCIFTDCVAGWVWQDSASCESAGSALSYANSTASASGAVELISAVRCVWRSKLKGPSNSVPGGGVVLTIDGGTGNACDFNEINCSGIDPGCLTGGSANKLLLGGTQITTTGITAGAPTGMKNNVVYGVMN